jgi:hypothetical protein
VTEILFSVLFPLAAPFWALMIFAPGWRWTDRIIGSPLIVVPAAAVYAALAIPHLGELLPALSQPSLDGVREVLGTAVGATLGWAHFIAFDLFVGRWMYLDARRTGIHPLAMAPLLVLTILLAPLGLLAYLVVRYLVLRLRPAPTT